MYSAREIQGNFGFVFKAGPLPLPTPPSTQEQPDSAINTLQPGYVLDVPIISASADRAKAEDVVAPILDKDIDQVPMKDLAQSISKRKAPKKRKALFTKKKPAASRSRAAKSAAVHEDIERAPEPALQHDVTATEDIRVALEDEIPFDTKPPMSAPRPRKSASQRTKPLTKVERAPALSSPEIIKEGAVEEIQVGPNTHEELEPPRKKRQVKRAKKAAQQDDKVVLQPSQEPRRGINRALTNDLKPLKVQPETSLRGIKAASTVVSDIVQPHPTKQRRGKKAGHNVGPELVAPAPKNTQIQPDVDRHDELENLAVTAEKPTTKTRRGRKAVPKADAVPVAALVDNAPIEPVIDQHLETKVESGPTKKSTTRARRGKETIDEASSVPVDNFQAESDKTRPPKGLDNSTTEAKSAVKARSRRNLPERTANADKPLCIESNDQPASVFPDSPPLKGQKRKRKIAETNEPIVNLEGIGHVKPASRRKRKPLAEQDTNSSAHKLLSPPIRDAAVVGDDADKANVNFERVSDDDDDALFAPITVPTIFASTKAHPSKTAMKSGKSALKRRLALATQDDDDIDLSDVFEGIATLAASQKPEPRATVGRRRPKT